MHFPVVFIIAVLSSSFEFVSPVIAQCGSLEPRCSSGWHLWGSSCYLMTESTYKWSEARDACNKLGGVLAVPHSLEEHRFIRTFTQGHWVWIDCSDHAVKGSWECKEGGVEVSFRKWDRNQPGGEGCAAISRSFLGWHDYCCWYVLRAICKQPQTQYRQSAGEGLCRLDKMKLNCRLL